MSQINAINPPTNANVPTTVQVVSGTFSPPVETIVLRTVNALLPPNVEPSTTVSCQRIMAYIRANFEFPGMTIAAVNGQVKAALARLEGRLTLVRMTGGGLRGSLRRGTLEDQQDGGDATNLSRRSHSALVSMIPEEPPASDAPEPGSGLRRRSARIAARDRASSRRYSPY